MQNGLNTKTQAGDILLYYEDRQGLKEEIMSNVVKLGAILEDGIQDCEVYHCAIALDGDHKLEADGTVIAIHPINRNGEELFGVFRPKVDPKDRNEALQYVYTFIGQKYDWFLIADEGIVDLTGGAIHFPTQFMERKELHMKICSTLAAFFLKKANYKVDQINKKKFNEPEDIYLIVKEDEVKGELAVG
jgi:hypothetical protein